MGITAEEISAIEYNIQTTSGMLGLTDQVFSGTVLQREVTQHRHTLNALENVKKEGPNRKLSKDMVLSLANYHLKKVEEKNEMLFIMHLEFTPQHIYQLQGL